MLEGRRITGEQADLARFFALERARQWQVSHCGIFGESERGSGRSLTVESLGCLD